MGVINETLLLTDQFSSSFNTFIDLGNRAVATTTAIGQEPYPCIGKISRGNHWSNPRFR